MKPLLERYAAAWAAGDRDAWLATFAEDATQEDPVGARIRRGRDDIGGFWDDAMAGYHAIAITPRQIFVRGRDAAMQWRIAAEVDDGWWVFDGVDVFTADDTPLLTSVRAYWESDNRQLVRRQDVIFHFAIAEHWHPDASVYLRSTVDSSLAEEGFIHCSFADQLDATRAKFYAGRDDVVLLAIDATRVGSEVKVEGGFPHIYGPLPVDAVISARHLT